MNLYTELLSRIKTACSQTSVSTAAGVVSGSWATYHIFDGGEEFIHGMNRGRVPFILIKRKASEYTFDAISVGDQGGQVTTTWTIKAVVGKTSRANESTNEEQAYGILQKCVKEMRASYNLAVGSGESWGEVENHPFGLSLTVEMNIQNTRSDSTL